MLTEYIVKRGFGKSKAKEYFVIQSDGDTCSGVVAGPFESRCQASDAIDALRPLYNRPLHCVGGHLVGWQQMHYTRLD
jgi:hypothetical protein